MAIVRSETPACALATTVDMPDIVPEGISQVTCDEEVTVFAITPECEWRKLGLCPAPDELFQKGQAVLPKGLHKTPELLGQEINNVLVPVCVQAAILSARQHKPVD